MWCNQNWSFVFVVKCGEKRKKWLHKNVLEVVKIQKGEKLCMK